MTYEEQERRLAADFIKAHGGEGKHTILAMLGLAETVKLPKAFSGQSAQPQGVRGVGYAGRTPMRLSSV